MGRIQTSESLSRIASINAIEQTFPQLWSPFNLPPTLHMHPLSTFQMPSFIFTNMSFPQVSEGSLIPGHLSYTLNPANHQYFMPVSPNAPSIENCPTIFADIPSLAPSNWDLNSPPQQTTNLPCWCGCLGPQIPRDISGEQSQAHQYGQCPGQHGFYNFYSHTRRTRKSYPCMIPGCSKSFSRSDYRGNHLRKEHRLPIPKGSRAHTWIESQQHLLETIAGQAREHT